MSDDAGVLALVPYRGHWEMDLYPGGHVIRAGCEHLAWISPAGSAWLERKPGLATACLPCTALMPTDSAYLVPGTMDDVRARLGEQEAERLGNWFTQRGIQEL